MLLDSEGATLGLDILVVDEDPETLSQITDLSKRYGHKVSSLQDAITLLSQLPLKPYDALIMVLFLMFLIFTLTLVAYECHANSGN